MLARPQFRPHLRVAAAPGEGVFVLSGSKQTLLRGRLYELVAPHVDGRPADEICQQLADRVSAAEVYYTLGQLEQKGYLAEADDAVSPQEAAWWSSQQIEPGLAARRLAETGLKVQAMGVDAAPLCELLQALGVRVGDDGLSVVVVDHYLRNQLDACNEAALGSERPWLLVKPLGRQLWLGPLFRPGATGCWKCLAERLRANSAVESYLLQRQALAEQTVADRAATPASAQTAFGLAASAIASWLVRGELPECDAKIRTFDLVTWETQTHTLVRLPYCPACSHPQNWDARHFRPLVLQPRQRSCTRDGGSRAISPEATLERYGRHVSPITGAVSMLERACPSADGAMHVYLAGHNLARRHHNLAQLRGDLRNMAAGKGVTDAQAKASGLCEGLERHSGVFRGDERRRTARMIDLGEAAIDPRSCQLFSQQQYREREVWNAKKSSYHFVPLPFNPEAEVEWSPLWSLSRQEPRYLPTAFCYYDYQQPKHQTYCVACSNGCAAGNTIEEAILQGFLELVERDSVALWWYNRVRRPGVDLDSFDEPYLAQLRDFLATRGREIHVLDLTADLEIPVFAAWSRRTDAPEEQIVMGFGAHLDARISLLRAVTEMNQMLSYLLEAPAEKIYNDQVTDPETVEWLKTATAANQPYLLPATGSPLAKAADYRSSRSDDIAEEIRVCQAAVERQGLEMLVLDQTRPEIGLPVVKVVVPGLRHFWARLAPGRLYDTPVKLGWLKRPLAEDELNPIPMFL